MLLLILDSLGGTELLVILVVALVIFGPRKLPELSRSLGRSLADFKRASHDFKETWEREARMADELKDFRIEQAMLPEETRATTTGTVGRASPFSASDAASATIVAASEQSDAPPLTVTDAVSTSIFPQPSVRPAQADATPDAFEPAPAPEPTQKRDWL